MDYRKMISSRTKKDHNSAAIAIALLAGATIGAAISLLLAPKTGAETRDLLSEKAKGLAGNVKDKFAWARNKAEDGLDQLTDHARDEYRSAKRKVKRGVDDLADNVNL